MAVATSPCSKTSVVRVFKRPEIIWWANPPKHKSAIAAPAVPTARTALGNESLAMEGDAAFTAMAGSRKDLNFVDKHVRFPSGSSKKARSFDLAFVIRNLN